MEGSSISRNRVYNNIREANDNVSLQLVEDASLVKKKFADFLFQKNVAKIFHKQEEYSGGSLNILDSLARGITIVDLLVGGVNTVNWIVKSCTSFAYT
jgi:hypothetical protein